MFFNLGWQSKAKSGCDETETNNLRSLVLLKAELRSNEPCHHLWTIQRKGRWRLKLMFLYPCTFTGTIVSSCLCWSNATSWTCSQCLSPSRYWVLLFPPFQGNVLQAVWKAASKIASGFTCHTTNDNNSFHSRTTPVFASVSYDRLLGPFWLPLETCHNEFLVCCPVKKKQQGKFSTKSSEGCPYSPMYKTHQRKYAPKLQP